MKRALAVAALTAVASIACHNWDGELSTVLGRLADGGAMPDSGLGGGAGGGNGGGSGGSGGGGGSDIDAGPIDAGCMSALCLTHTIQSGASFRPIVPLGPHSFMAAGRSLVGPEQLAVSIDGGFEVRPMPSTFYVPYGLAGPSPDLYFVASEISVVRVESGIATKGDKCGLQSLNPIWYAASTVSPNNAFFSGTNFAVCEWTPDAGFVGTDLAALGGWTETNDLYGMQTFSTGERFFVGDDGALVFWSSGNAMPMLYRHSVGQPQGYEMAAINGSSLDALWAVGEYGVLARWVPNAVDGGSWSEPPQIPTAPSRIISIWVRNNQDVWVAGFAGFVRHWNGTTWETLATEGVDSTVDLKGVGGTGADDLILAGTRNLPDGGEQGLLLYYRRN
jgi:hypothetical protein